MERPDPDRLYALYNPLRADFEHEWLDNENNPHVLIIKANEIGQFKKPQYDFMKKHLMDHIMYTREKSKGFITPQMWKKVEDEIVVEL